MAENPTIHRIQIQRAIELWDVEYVLCLGPVQEEKLDHYWIYGVLSYSLREDEKTIGIVQSTRRTVIVMPRGQRPCGEMPLGLR